MNIPQSLAQNIVESMKNIIEQDINFMDLTGKIIASTDFSRLGDIHEGALNCIRNNDNLIIEQNDFYKGSKKGINLPVYFNNKIIGVIGITGNKSEVSKYGEIIQKMTEILISEDWVNELINKRKENSRILLENIINNRDFNTDNYAGLDIQSNKFIIVAKNKEKYLQLTDKDNQNLYTILNKHLSYDKYNLFSIFYDEVVILFNSSSRTEVEYLIDDLNKNFKLKNLNLLFGVSKIFKEYKNAKSIYNQSLSALKWLYIDNARNKYVQFYEDLKLGLLFSKVDDYIISEYCDTILKNIDDYNFEMYKELINSYTINNGSINKCAKELFIHKNTIQYRLNKIYELTGLNPRNLKDFTILRLAFLLR